jgi:hypothetical protein
MTSERSHSVAWQDYAHEVSLLPTSCRKANTRFRQWEANWSDEHDEKPGLPVFEGLLHVLRDKY